MQRLIAAERDQASGTSLVNVPRWLLGSRELLEICDDPLGYKPFSAHKDTEVPAVVVLDIESSASEF